MFNFRADILCCLDANFSQKRRKSTSSDPQVHHPNSKFLSLAAVQAMEERVRIARGSSRSTKKSNHNPPVVSHEILDECKRSFLAANENLVKASKNYYADTGLMALLCRHDQVLWLVNLTTPGERQHYALALLDELSRHLPSTWTVGFLYDIACQLHRSMFLVCFLGLSSFLRWRR